MMDKRPLVSPKSTSSKRNKTSSRIVEDEVIKPIKRNHKSTYFFGPVNNLTNPINIRAKSPIKKHPAKNLLAPPSTSSRLQVTPPPQHENSRPESSVTASDDHPNETSSDLLAPQSSDDSFEGIKWKASPRKPTSKDRLPSSPLKNVVSSPVMSRKDLEGITVNEQTNSMLSKYGDELHNIVSQSVPSPNPSLQRTHSDATYTKSSKEPESPSLKRTKSTGWDGLLRSKTKKSTESKVTKSLNTWINKFELTSSFKTTNESETHREDGNTDKENEQKGSDEGSGDEKKNDIAEGAIINENNEVTVNSIAVNVQNQSESMEQPELDRQGNETEESDDPFSDDDNELLAALATQKEKKQSSREEPQSDSDDPFTDDDSALIELLGLPKPQQSSPKYGTTSKSQDKRDLSHANSFKNSIQKFEELQLTRATYIEDDAGDVELSYTRSDLKRYKIDGILEKFYGPNMSRRQLVLEVSDAEGKPHKLIVRGEYIQLDFEINDVIHIVITNPASPRLIDDTNNLLIWNPDTLVSATSISQQLNCPRKVVLTNRLKFPGASSLPIIIGEIIHNIFQACFTENRCSMDHMLELTDHYIEVFLLSILSVGPEVQTVKEEVIKQLPYLQTWFQKFYKKPLSNSNKIQSGFKQEAMLSVEEVLEVEENIWSPMFGVKGMVDATLEVRVKESAGQRLKTGPILMPMEIKTGREYITHHAQASLYALLYKDRYEMDINSFLLVYTRDLVTKKCDISNNDLRSLVSLRNRITKYFKRDTRELPPLLKRTACDICDVQESCMTINKLSEDGTAEESGIPVEVYRQITDHLNDNEYYKQFYGYWDQLLTSEEGIARKALKYLWVHTAKRREEEHGMAIGGLVITDTESKPLEERYYYTFKRANPGDWFSSRISKYDRVIISDEAGHFALGKGSVMVITSDTIVVSTSKRILTSDLKLNSNKEQAYKSALRDQISYSASTTFRIDKDEFFEGMGLARYNILNLFLNNGDEKRRHMVVDLQKPRFSKKPLPFKVESKYNSDQLKAFNKVLSAEDYALILGMPGTGKTTVIAQLIKFLVDNNKTVFLASYTHSAVDNILIKLKDYNVDFLRIGYMSRVHKEIQPYVPGSKIRNYQEFCDTYLSPPVVASTCLGIGDIAFNLRSKFDYCIIDEASQVSMPTSLGPLRFCDKFVLVGDHYQLPPLILHPDPKIKQGLTKSLFKMLADAHPQSLVELTYQYRMCYDIMQLSNVLIYNNRLKCGSKEVADQCLNIPNPENLERFVDKSQTRPLWIHYVLKEENKVLFLNHDNLSAEERSVGQSTENPVEAELTRQLVEGLIQCGVKEDSIGVMSFNRAQVRLLGRKLHDKKSVEILTADQFQGRDKDCVIISLVRSNKMKKAGDLVQEWRRINVAITRSRSKLIILGSESTLSSVDTLRTFFDLLKDREWIYNLEPDSTITYNFPMIPSMSQNGCCPASSNPRLIKKGSILNDIVNDLNG